MTYSDQQQICDNEDFSHLYEYDPVDYYDLHQAGTHAEDQQAEESIDELALISNDDFMAAIFGTEFDGERPLVCKKPGDPDQGGWFAKTWPCNTKDANQNWYFLPGLYEPNSAGQYRAKKELAIQIYAVVVDDVGTKVRKERFNTCPPSWAIETSPNNFQYGFILSSPETDVDAMDQLKTDLIAAGLCDPGASGGKARWSRLPVAINGRPKYGTPSHKCSLVVWCPTLKYSVDELYSKLSLGVKPAAEPSMIGHPPSTLTQVSAMAAEAEIVIERLKAVGLYKAPLGSGKHDITCPWVEQHTDAIDNGTAYFEPSAQFPTGGFKCHHSHGHLFSISSLKVFLNLETKEIHTVPIRLPQKLPDGLLPVEPLDPALLPSTISDAIVDISERLSCPIEFVAIPVLTAAGIAIGNRIGVLPKKYDDSWEVYPGFWGGIVGSPGSMKTPAQNESFRCLHYLEDQAGAAYAQAMDVYNKDMKIYEKQLKDFKNGKTTVWPVEPSKPPRVRYIVNDVTYQALGEILAENPSGVLALADEMSGLLQSLDTPGQEAARGFFLQGWGGRGNYTFDRITRGTVVLKNYMLALFGGFQPDRIKLYVRGASSGSSHNDGLMQRFQLLVWPNSPDEIKIVDRPPNRAAIQKMESAIIQLRTLATSGLADSEKNSIGASLLHFDDQAQTIFDNWYRKNEEMLRNGELSQAEHSHFAKYRSLVPGLALVFHLLEGHTGRICPSCLENALRLTAVLKSHAHRVYASVYGLDNEPPRALARRILKGELKSGFTARSVYLKGWNGLSRANVTPALELLTELGWLNEIVVQTGGRSSVQYLINPNVSVDLLK